MARPKIVRTKEEAAAIDPSLPIQVEVREDQAVQVAVPPSGNGVTPLAAPPAPPPPSVPDEEMTSLKAQIAQMKKNAEEQAKQLAEAQRREAELHRQYTTRQQESQTHLHRAHQAELDAVSNAEAIAQQALDSAKTALNVAGQTQDWSAMAEAQERISDAKDALREAQRAKAYITERAKAQPQAQQQQLSTNDSIDRMPISMEQKNWFKRHPDVLYDDFKMTKARMAHYEALNRGLTMDSPDYYDVIDVAMGYKSPPKSEDADDDNEPASPPAQIVSAPVSRDAPSATTGRPSTTRITLTAAQREAARDAGVDEVTYARGLLELERRKQAGLYQNG